MSEPTLEPGTHIDSHWGHYQSQRIIEMANELGWPDPNPGETALLLEAYPDLDELEGTTEIANPHEIWDELVQEAEAYINENHVPDNHWFGHHPDIGDVGVWLQDDLRQCDQCGRITEAGEWPDWINGKCEQCDLDVLDDPVNTERVSPEQLAIAQQEVMHFHSRRN